MLTVDPPSIGYEAKGLDLVHEVLKRRIHDVVQLRLEQAFYDPKTVPVIYPHHIS